jgi:NitT/TauT family transport system permease protein
MRTLFKSNPVTALRGGLQSDIMLVAVLRIAVVIATLLGWIVGSHVSPLIPTPYETVKILYRALFTSGEFRSPLGFSLQPILEGFGIAAAAGVTVGLWLGLSQFWRDVLGPPLNGLFAVPRIIVYPVLLAAFGVTMTSEMWLAVIAAFFPIAINATAGTRAVSPVLSKLATSFSCSTLQAIRKIYLPAALPAIMVGIRLGFSGAFVTVTGAEIYASRGGIGQILSQAYQLQQYPRLFAAVLLLTLIALAGNVLLLAFERRAKVAAD